MNFQCSDILNNTEGINTGLQYYQCMSLLHSKYQKPNVTEVKQPLPKTVNR